MSTILRSYPDSPAQDFARSLRTPSAAIWGPRLSVLVVLIWVSGLAIGFQAALAVLTALGFSVAVFGLLRPSLGLLGVGMLCALDALARVYLMQGGLLRWNTFNYWLLLVMLVAAPTLLRQKDPHSRLLQALILLLLMELAWAPRLTTGVTHVLNAVSLFGLLVYFLRAAHDASAWYWLGVVTGVLGALGCPLYYIQRHALPYIDANAFCYFPLTALFAICLAFRFAEHRNLRQIVLLTLATANFCWVFLSSSRQGLLVALVCAAFLLVRTGRLRYRIMLVTCAVMCGLLIIGSFAEMRDQMLRRVEKLLDPRSSAASRTSGRYDLALGAWRVFLDHPLGVGTGGYASFWAGLSNREGLSGFGLGQERMVHNAWLQVLAENGIPGFFLFAGYVSSFAMVGWRKRPQQLLAIGMLATVALAAAFLATQFDGKGTWFLAAGATVLLHEMYLPPPSAQPPGVSTRSITAPSPTSPGPRLTS